MAKKTVAPKGKTAAPKGVTLVRELTDILDDAGLVELEYATDEVEIRLSKAASVAAPAMPASAPAATQPAAPAAAEAAPTAEAAAVDHPGAVKAPMVGTVYLSPEPGADQFIKTGDSVTSGQTLLIIEAMKVMNPITAPSSGTVKSILVDNSQPVEYGEALVIIE
jgi:acetyl-CoA carboxylase biotin carboxyl carrier protein